MLTLPRVELREDQLPKREVTRAVFESTAIQAGWQLRSIQAFLHDPPCRGYVRVGDEMLRPKP